MSFPQSRAAATGIGKPVQRKEDERLLTGRGRFSDDVNLPGQAYAAFVRSPHAHARIVSIEKEAAMEIPGVLAVLTGADAAADGLKPIPCKPITANPHEVPLKGSFPVAYPALTAHEVRYVGQAVALVVAETAAAAKDAAERVAVDYEVLAAVTTATQALQDRANVCVDCGTGDAVAVEEAFRRAAHVVKLDTVINRVTGVPMEARVTVAEFSAGRYTVYATSGGVQKHRTDIAEVLGVPETAVRVLTGDLGGNYGPRNTVYAEYALIPWAARRAGRPVKWTCERTEAFLTDEHTRDLTAQAELALDRDGNFLALRGTFLANAGAYAVSLVPLAKGIGISPSLYRIAAGAIRAIAVLSHTSPTSPYRAAGRPEALYVTERLIDMAARRHGFDRIALRRKNLVTSFPHKNPFGLVYDSGDYVATQDRVLEIADWKGFESRGIEARKRNRLRGIGVSNYIELNTGAPRERAEVRVQPDGTVEVIVGTLSSGQGHETSFAQVIAEWLGVDFWKVRLITGDTDVAQAGGGTHSGRSMRMAAAVMRVSCDQIIEQGKRAASEKLEAAQADIEFTQGRFTVKGTDRSVALAELAPLSGSHDETTWMPSYPFGCAVCEVEVDPETGVVTIERHTNVDDCGLAVNPLILHGQTHGGIVAGVGQALWEHCVYDPDSGQMLSASFMDYVMPRADQFPFFGTEISEVPSTTHPLGMRGGGEGGTTPALAAVANAIVDALAEYGVEHIELPATPEKVWRAIHHS
jgi:carbon-monoxide dehydrogenase large subunit